MLSRREQLTGRWQRGDGALMFLGPRGKVKFGPGGWSHKAGWYHAKFSHITAHKQHGRLSISGPQSCSGTGTYRWTITPTHGLDGTGLHFTKIHDACKHRVNLLIETDDGWGYAN
jgi:hypothetical protein